MGKNKNITCNVKKAKQYEPHTDTYQFFIFQKEDTNMSIQNENKGNKRNKAVRAGAVVLATAALVGGAFSYFTDYESRDLQAKAGTLTMELANVTTDLTNGLTIVNPGDSNPFDFTVNNTGEKSMDVKAVIKVTAPIAMTDADHEFKITTPEGEELKGVLSEDKKSITYTIDDVALAGSVEKDMDKDGATTTSHAYKYKFVMDENAKNAWQNQQADVKLEVFAKQHRNTAGLGTGWTSIVEK